MEGGYEGVIGGKDYIDLENHVDRKRTQDTIS